MTSTKIKVSSITHVLTQHEEDEKVQKQKQSELTKQIVIICESLGYPTKSGASSLEEGQLAQVLSILKKEGLSLNEEKTLKRIKEYEQEKKSKSLKAKEVPEVQEAPLPVKKQIKIVRRIKPTPPVEEKLPEVIHVEIKPPETHQIPVQPPVIKEEPRVILPSRPLPGLPVQPFRVARPTMAPSMMGRTKRPQPRTRTRTQQRGREKEKKEEQTVATITKPVTVVLISQLTVKELADRLTLPETEVVKNLFSKGVIKTVNQTIELEVAIECAKSLGYEVITEEAEKENILQPDISLEDEANLVPRPPVVTIMGHVDHGKTTLLDAIRETKLKITEQEAGGITQHIGAYQVEILDYDGNKRKITFLDTPGHEAFTAMRARGAQVTDIAILVVAADDGVKPQTVEAISHAKAAGVPIVIALNKIDKDGAQPDKVLGELTKHDLLVEDYGGKTVCSSVSAKKRINLDDLLTKITLVADAELSQKLRANPNSFASGAVIEAQLSKERGPVAHLLVQNGTLRKGDCLVAGKVAGRVRAMFNDLGVEVEEALPSMPVEVIGLPDVPNAGDTFQVHKTYQEAKEVAAEKQKIEQERHRTFGLVDFASKVREGQAHELKIIVKADVQGSSEAVSTEIVNLSTDEVLVRLMHVGTGNISESDINLASSTGAIIIGFHIDCDSNTKRIADEQGVDIRIYDIIYKITEDLEKAVLGLLEPEKIDVKLGVIEVRKIFTYGKGHKIAGCYVNSGKAQRNQIAKVFRSGKLIYEGKVDNLKRFKDDAREVQAGFECGVSFENFQDLEEGDIIECWTIIEKERTSLS